MDHFAAERGMIPFATSAHDVFTVYRVDGRVVRFGAVNASRRQSRTEGNWLVRTVDELNARRHQPRGGTI